MNDEKIVKLVYIDDNKNKVIKGKIISEEEFLYTIQAEHSGTIFTIGKRNVISMRVLE